eukprot:scaffold110046_cov56-Phaeocystis_antarctica.AAC.2
MMMTGMQPCRTCHIRHGGKGCSRAAPRRPTKPNPNPNPNLTLSLTLSLTLTLTPQGAAPRHPRATTIRPPPAARGRTGSSPST